MTDTNKERAAAFTQACQDLGAIAALLGFDRFPGVDSVLARVTDLIVSAPPVAAKAPAAPTQASPDGWKWMTHPSRNGGLPIPVRVFAEDGVTYYQPFSEADCEFEWESRDSEWHEAAPPAPTEQWIGVTERLPEWVHRDDTPCHINGKEVPPTLTSKTVLVALDGGGVRTDKLTTIEGKSNGWWNTFGERVIAWQDAPAPPQGAAKGDGNG